MQLNGKVVLIAGGSGARIASKSVAVDCRATTSLEAPPLFMRVYVVSVVSPTGFSKGGTDPLGFPIDVKILAA